MAGSLYYKDMLVSKKSELAELLAVANDSNVNEVKRGKAARKAEALYKKLNGDFNKLWREVTGNDFVPYRAGDHT